MANKFLKRTLSVVMCAAMLVSVFAVSFTASAEIKTDDTDTETTYTWDYENDTENAYSETLANSVIKSSKPDDSTDSVAKVSVGENNYLSIDRIGTNGGAVAAFFTAPENKSPKTFTVESSQYYKDGMEKDFAGGALIAKYIIEKNGSSYENAVSFYAYTVEWSGQNAKLCLGLRKHEYTGWDNNDPNFHTKGVLKYNGDAQNTNEIRAILLSPTNNEPVISNNNGDNKTGQGNYANTSIWGESGNRDNIPNSKIGDFRYTYHITYTNDGVEVYVTAKYGDLTVNTATYTVSYSDLKAAIGSACTSVEPMCGLSSVYISKCTATDTSAKIYKVRATYAPESSTVEPEITASANVVLDEGIKLKITAEGNEGIQADTLKLTVDGEGKELTNGAAIIPKFAHQMADKMKIVITADDVNGNTITKTIGDDESGYSIADNLANTYDQLTAEKDAATKKLIAKLANYGAAAQQYDALANNIEYTQLANYFLDDADKTPDAEAYNTMESVLKGTFVKEDSDVFTTGLKASLAIGLQENIKMIIRVSGINLGDNQNLYVKMDGTDYPLTEKNGVYTGQFGEFKPKEYADSKTITLVVKSNDTETSAEEEVSGEVTYSVGTYINRMASKSSDGLKLLLNAITEYSTAYAEVYNALTNLV